MLFIRKEYLSKHTFHSHNQWPDQVGHEFPSLEDNMGNNIPDTSEDAQDGSPHVDNYQLLGCQMVAKDHSIVGCKSQCLLEKIRWPLYYDFIFAQIEVIFILQKKRNKPSWTKNICWPSVLYTSYLFCISQPVKTTIGKEWEISYLK